MSEEWVVVRDGNKLGPISTGQLKAMVAADQLNQADLIIKDGMEGKRLASILKEFFPQHGPIPSIKYNNNDLLYSAITPLTIVMFAFYGLQIITLFLPWWSFNFKGNRYGEASIALHKEFGSHLLENIDWYSNTALKPLSRQSDDSSNERTFSSMTFGFSTAACVVQSISVVVALPLLIAPIFYPLLRQWRWIAFFASSFFAIVGVILAIILFVSAPSIYLPPFFSSGTSFGLYVFLIAAIGSFISSSISAILEMLTFMKNVNVAR